MQEIKELEQYVEKIKFKKREGSICNESGILLNALVTYFKPKVFLEVGFHWGKSATYICEAMKRNRFGNFFTLEKDHKSNCLEPYFKEKYPFFAMIEGDSTKILSNLNMNLDMVFIDGGHDYKTCLSDMQCCWKMLNKQGLMVVDDVDSVYAHQGVISSVGEFLMKERCNKLLCPGPFSNFDYPEYSGMLILQK